MQTYPCKDKSEWEKMNGPTILPPLYQKHVGRPTKNRRKAPGEVDYREGGKKCQEEVSLCTAATVGIQIIISVDATGSRMV
jgi:hypothetical protein